MLSHYGSGPSPGQPRLGLVRQMLLFERVWQSQLRTEVVLPGYTAAHCEGLNPMNQLSTRNIRKKEHVQNMRAD